MSAGITIQAEPRKDGPGWSVAAYGKGLGRQSLNLTTKDEGPDALARLFAAVGRYLATGGD